MSSGKKTQIAILGVALLLAAGIIGSGLNFGSTDNPPSEDTAVRTGTVANTNSSPIKNDAQTMLTYIDQQIAIQEDVKDVRCWSSVNKIQTFISGLPIDTEAVGERVECYIGMLDQVWDECSQLCSDSQSQTVTAEQVKRFLDDRFPKMAQQANSTLKAEDAPSFDVNLFDNEEQNAAIVDYSDTIESWRLLQSWLLRKVDVPTTNESVPFSDEALLELKRFLVVYDINLLKRARLVAMKKKLARVNVEIMKEAFDLQWRGEASH